jgi:peptidoglycan/LPS O-acetylase OafA/YrhL
MPFGFQRRFFCSLVLAQTFWGLGWENRGGSFFISVPLFNFLLYGIFFFTGVVYFLNRSSLIPNHTMALISLCIFVSTFRSPLGRAGEILAVPYLVHYIAHTPVPLWRMTNPTGDISYGVYIYAFPIQQCVFVTCSTFLGFFEMIFLALLLATGAGLLSWRYIESPALRWKQQLANRKTTIAPSFERAASQT